MDGIRNFLKGADAEISEETYFDVPMHEGFVVNHTDGAVDVLRSGEARNFVQDMTPRPNDEDWMIKFEKGEDGWR